MAMTSNRGDTQSLSLVIRKLVYGNPEAAFAAWTAPDQIRQWWGPDNVSCPECDVDLRVGGSYKIANQFPDGSIVWIIGNFVRIEPPHLIEYTWRIEPRTITANVDAESVTVRFVAQDNQTELVLVHSRIANGSLKASHDSGWSACLEGLADFMHAQHR